MNLRRGLVTVAVALCAFAAVPAAAARLSVADRGLASGAAAVGRCDTSVTATTVVTGTTVTGVSVAGIDAACAGATLRVTASGSTGTALGAGTATVPTGGGTVVVALSPQPSSMDVTGLGVLVQGAAGNGTAGRLRVASQSLASFSTSVTPSSGILLALVNGSGGTAGRADRGDAVVVTFPRPVVASSICSSWTGSGSVSNKDVVVTIADGGAGNDVLTVAVPSGNCSTFRFGSVDLGGSGFVTATTTFGGAAAADRSSVAFDAAASRITVTLGRPSATTPVSASTIATYAPADGLQHTTAPTAVTGTASTGLGAQL